MKKLIIFFSIFLFHTGVSKAQEKRNNVNYQYIRTDNEYYAYTAFVNQDVLVKRIELELISTFKLDNLESITIKKGNSLIKVSFVSLNTIIQNDDKNLNGLLIIPNLDKVWKTNIDCATTIVFMFACSKKIELPFMYCNLKEQIK